MLKINGSLPWTKEELKYLRRNKEYHQKKRLYLNRPNNEKSRSVVNGEKEKLSSNDAADGRTTLPTEHLLMVDKIPRPNPSAHNMHFVTGENKGMSEGFESVAGNSKNSSGSFSPSYPFGGPSLELKDDPCYQYILSIESHSKNGQNISVSSDMPPRSNLEDALSLSLTESNTVQSSTAANAFEPIPDFNNLGEVFCNPPQINSGPATQQVFQNFQYSGSSDHSFQQPTTAAHTPEQFSERSHQSLSMSALNALNVTDSSSFADEFTSHLPGQLGTAHGVFIHSIRGRLQHESLTILLQSYGLIRLEVMEEHNFAYAVLKSADDCLKIAGDWHGKNFNGADLSVKPVINNNASTEANLSLFDDTSSWDVIAAVMNY